MVHIGREKRSWNKKEHPYWKK